MALSESGEQKTVEMPEGFRQAFHVVIRHYECSNDEISLMIKLVRSDPENAANAFFSMQREIVGHLELAKGINERIRAGIEARKAVEETKLK